jgi:hypothetical protein
LLQREVGAGADNSFVLLGIPVSFYLHSPAILNKNFCRTPGCTALTSGGHPFAWIFTYLVFLCVTSKSIQNRLANSNGCSGCCAQLKKISSLDFHHLLLCLNIE